MGGPKLPFKDVVKRDMQAISPIRGRLSPVIVVRGEQVALKPYEREESFCTSQWVPAENVRRSRFCSTH